MYRTWQGGAEIAAIVIFVSILVMDHFEAGCIWSVSTLNGLGVDLWWLAHWPQNTEYWPMWHITVIQEHVHSISHNLILVHYPYVLLWTGMQHWLHSFIINHLLDIYYVYELLSITGKGGSWCRVKKILTNFSGFPRCADWQRRELSSERLWHSDSSELTVE